MSKTSKIQVEDKLISIIKKDKQDYICLTAMLATNKKLELRNYDN